MTTSGSDTRSQRTLTRRALKALSELGDLRCGPLSPLARVAAPDAPADRAALIAALTAMSGDWAWCPPALLDPRLTLAVIVADREQQLIGQHLWADAAGASPGFKLSVGNEELELSGPLTPADVGLTLLDLLALGGVAEVPPLRMALAADEYWALAALVDAHGTAAALRAAGRAAGPPPGVTVADVVASWNAGLALPNPAWSVALGAWLAPDDLPADFAQRLPDALARMQQAGLLSLIEGEDAAGLDTICLLGEGLQLLARGLASGGIGFGCVRAEVAAPAMVEIARIAGWRTPGGMLLADLSALAQDRVELLLCGPSHCAEFVMDLLGGNDAPAAAAVPDDASPYAPTRLLQRLREGAAPAATPAATCPRCQAPVRSGARFCASCGRALAA